MTELKYKDGKPVIEKLEDIEQVIYYTPCEKLMVPIYTTREEGCSKKFLGSIYQYANI